MWVEAYRVGVPQGLYCYRVDSSDDLRQVIDWVRSTSAYALAADLVPGTTATQRHHLAAAGGLVAAVVPEAQWRDWPEAVQAWVAAAPAPPSGVAEAMLRALRRDPEVFATIYCALVAGQNRRRLGTFFTPRPVVEFMLDKVSPPPRGCSLIDPGAGVGAFGLAAATRWPGIDVVAVDVNVVTLGFLGAALDRDAAPNVRLVHADYLEWLPEQHAADQPTVLVGNPPYTRHQELDRKTKRALAEAAGDLVTSQLAGLSAYFLAASFSSMRPQDALCFVLPSTWTQARYGRELREWLWQQAQRSIEMHLFPADARIFPGTKVSAMVLYVGPHTATRSPLTRHRATLDESKVTTTTGDHAPRTEGMPASLGPWLWRHAAAENTGRLPLREIATVRRGVATGANFFFFLTDEVAEHLPEVARKPALRRLRHVGGDVLDTAEHRRIGALGNPRWLLTLTDPDIVDHPAIQRMLELGRDAGVAQRYLSTVREPWYALEHVEPPHLFVGAMTKNRLRVVRNVVKAVHSNSMYGIYLKRPSLAPALATWLNGNEGQAAILSDARHYSDGLKKLEPTDLLRVLVPSEESLRIRT